MSEFLKIRDFFLKSDLRKTAEFSVSDTVDQLILTCLNKLICQASGMYQDILANNGKYWQI